LGGERSQFARRHCRLPPCDRVDRGDGLMSAADDPQTQFYADVHAIRDAVAKDIKTSAYIFVGGANGCAICADRTMAESVAAGHERCAADRVKFDVLEQFARHIAGGDIWIAIARAMEDPRMFQWVGRIEASS
jgi:hypothetical protein